MRVAFDVDGTLRDYQYEKRTPLVDLARVLLLLRGECEVIVWSGGGLSNAQRAVEEFGLTGAIAMPKPHGWEQIKNCAVDIAFDDESSAELASIMAVVRDCNLD